MHKYDSVIFGDSVVWGVYGTRDETLSHYLNEIEGGQRYANLGLVGAHPLALEGLIRHYADNISDSPVILQVQSVVGYYSSGKDLQDDKRNEFYHTRLVPQFWPRIPAYSLKNYDINTRLGAVVEQHNNFSPWTSHLQQAYYDHKDIPSWAAGKPLQQSSEAVVAESPHPE